MPFKKGQSGNPNGKPLGANTKVKALEDAIRTVEKKKKKKLLIHAVETAFTDTKVLAAILKKIIPDLKAVEISGKDGGPIETYSKEEKDGLKKLAIMAAKEVIKNG